MNKELLKAVKLLLAHLTKEYKKVLKLDDEDQLNNIGDKVSALVNMRTELEGDK